MLSRLFLIFIIFFAVGVFIGSFLASPAGGLNLSVYFGLLFVFLATIFAVLGIMETEKMFVQNYVLMVK